MTEQEAREEAERTGGTAYYDRYIGWYVLPAETQASLERQLQATREAPEGRRLMPPSYWAGAAPPAPTPPAPPAAVTPTEGFDVGEFLAPGAFPPAPYAWEPPAVGGEWRVPGREGEEEGLRSDMPPRDEWPEGYHPEWDSASFTYVWVPDPFTGMSDADKAAIELTQQQFEWDSKMDMLRYEQQQEATLWQRQQAEREYAAGLAAEPISWLQHAAYTGQQAVVQPWMKPLMPEQYGELGVGAPIPGFPQLGTPGPTGGGWPSREQTMTGMPGLTTPSRQYQARMGPTSLQQYLGYQQAQTGARPEETQWRLWSQAPPTGQYTGLTRAR